MSGIDSNLSIYKILKVQKLNDLAILPTQGSTAAAGWDLYAAIKEDIILLPGETEKIGTGLSIEIPENYFGAIFARSGIATNNGIRPSNCVGVIDSDYRGEVIVALHNDSNFDFKIIPNMRIAQLIIIPYLSIEINEVQSLNTTSRGAGGFGSTGI